MKCAYAPCGAEFKPKSAKASYCCSSHRYLAWRRRHLLPLGTVPVPAGATILKPGMVQTPAPAIAVPAGAEAVPQPLDERVGWELETLRARVAELEKRIAGVQVRRGDPLRWKHGANCYRNHGCRCRVCTEGNRLWSVLLRRRKKLTLAI